MAASKNAKKRRAKTQKKQKDTESEFENPTESRTDSLERSISPISPVRSSQDLTKDSSIIEHEPSADLQDSDAKIESSEESPSRDTSTEKNTNATKIDGSIDDNTHASPAADSASRDDVSNVLLAPDADENPISLRDSLLPAFQEIPQKGASPKDSAIQEFPDYRADEPAAQDSKDAEPEIPRRSAARAVENDAGIMLEAKREQVSFAKPVMLREVCTSATSSEAATSPRAASNEAGFAVTRAGELSPSAGSSSGKEETEDPSKGDNAEENESGEEINVAAETERGAKEHLVGEAQVSARSTEITDSGSTKSVGSPSSREAGFDFAVSRSPNQNARIETVRAVSISTLKSPEDHRKDQAKGPSSEDAPAGSDSHSPYSEQLGHYDDNIESDFDPDLYFSGPEDEIVTAEGPQNRSMDSTDARSPENDSARAGTDHNTAGDANKESYSMAASLNTTEDLDLSTEVSRVSIKSSPEKKLSQAELQTLRDGAEALSPARAETASVRSLGQASALTALTETPADAATLNGGMSPGVGHAEESSAMIESKRAQPGMIRRVEESASLSETPPILRSPLASRTLATETPRVADNSPNRDSHLSLNESPIQSPSHYAQWTKTHGSRSLGATPTLELPQSSATSLSLEEPQHSPNASPRPYKYAQSPLPPSSDEHKTEPPIFGVCVVGFHHKRGPEVEYWVGPKESHSNMWPYLPFQSLPDGSHQFEENVCYFTLLYDRNKCASTSLTFLRDEDGHIQEGTSDFRNVTTLFAIACSRQVAVDDLDHIGDDEEYTRSVVQKSVVVIASKPIFGPIKEKLTVVTRSFFNQRNFNDKTIIDHFYGNLVQMPLWANEQDHQVGMNLQRCVHDFGSQVLTILKAMMLELKILFYSSDTDQLGTTQFALISLIPNLINHLEDSGSPLLSSYELDLETSREFRPNDRASLLGYAGLPLQLFAGGGVFAPFVPLQQFDDLKQPETRYGMFGTANNLFLGNDIDFDVVVNVDTHTVQIKRNDLSHMLKLTDADRAFAQDITQAVDKAWDSEDRWQPQALGYYGGEDYIRHEFEEYLLALLSSAKFAKSFQPTPTSESASTNAKLSATDERDVTAALHPWGKAWTEKWMSSTNNFRIFDKQVNPGLFRLVGMAHPGQKLLKPSGFERFLGLFKSKPPPSPSAKPSGETAQDTASHDSPNSSRLETPVLNGDFGFKGAEKDGHTEPQTPQDRQIQEQ